jgi:hypothetical protein
MVYPYKIESYTVLSQEEIDRINAKRGNTTTAAGT